MNAPFKIFPWDKPFMPSFKNLVDELSGGRPGRALIVTPHLRPARYMTRLYRREKKAMLLPKMLRVNDLVSAWRAKLAAGPLRAANALDQVELLYQCVKELDLKKPLTASLKAASLDLGSFMPWGMRLAKILEDAAVEGVQIKNLRNVEFELGKTAAAILASLEEIESLWERKLAERGLTTLGQDHKFAAANADKIPEIFMPGTNRPVILTGFYILPGTHKALFKSLWNAGAVVCLHTDPAVMEGAEHWSCSHHRKWINDWKAEKELISAAPAGAAKTAALDPGKMDFFAGYDFHSQLEEINRVLREDGASSVSTAIIPCREEALSFLVQNLPPQNVNVSIGCPMERSPLIRLIQAVLDMRLNRTEDGRLRSADALAVIRHPYVRMARGGDGASLFQLEREILLSGLYWSKDGGESLEPGVLDVINGFFKDFNNMRGLAAGLEELCGWLHEKIGSKLDRLYPLDREAMRRLLHNVIPALKNNALADEPLLGRILIDLFNGLVSDENIPFDAEPIEGLQVIGLLESRLLQFDRVFLLDANDDTLPKKAGQDPLLPDSLRFHLNLPDNSQREAAYAHYLFRLLAGAGEARFLWQEGVSGGEFYDSKKVRSRFIERLIWEKEKADPTLLENNKSAARRPKALLKIAPKKARPLERSAALNEALENFWAGPVSVTAFDAYLACPVSFIRSYIMGLQGPLEAENRNRVAGILAHKALELLYKGMNGGFPEDMEDKEGLAKLVDECFHRAEEAMKEEEGADLDGILAIDELAALRITMPGILKKYLLKKYEKKREACLKLEERIDGEIAAVGSGLILKGKIDRIDKGAEGLYIVDYKTGSSQLKNKPGFWDDAAFFARAAKALAQKKPEELDSCFRELRKNVQSLQLPAYLLLLSETAGEDGFPANAAWSYLRLADKESFLLDVPLSGPDDPRLERFKLALSLVRDHSRFMPAFTPENSKNCDYCGAQALCGM